jgi:glycosyltransferase involved in cell wall biosynthesis
VLIRAYNRPASLTAAIESVLAQTYGDFEIVVSDDSGELGSVSERFGDPRVRYHRNPAPAGPAANLRRAIGLARGPLLAMLNDDDQWHPEFLETAVGKFDLDPDLGVVFTDYFFDVAGRRVPRRFPYAPGRHDRFLRQILEHSIPVSANVMGRAVWDDGERSVPLRDGMVGDLTTWLRAASAGYAFYYVCQPLAVIRIHRGQLSWSEAGLPTRIVATLSAFRFDDPVCEQLRRARLAECFLARAHVHIAGRRFGAARADLNRAREAAAETNGLRAALALSGLRGLTMRWGSAHPRLLVSLLELWRRVRPPVLRRRGSPRAALGSSCSVHHRRGACRSTGQGPSEPQGVTEHP